MGWFNHHLDPLRGSVWPFGAFGVGAAIETTQPSTIAARIFLWAANETCSTGAELRASKQHSVSNKKSGKEILENKGLN